MCVCVKLCAQSTNFKHYLTSLSICIGRQPPQSLCGLGAKKNGKAYCRPAPSLYVRINIDGWKRPNFNCDLPKAAQGAPVPCCVCCTRPESFSFVYNLRFMMVPEQKRLILPCLCDNLCDSTLIATSLCFV